MSDDASSQSGGFDPSSAPRAAPDSGRLDRFVEGITDYAIYALSPDGIVETWNAGAERFKQYRPAEIVGGHFSDFYTGEDRANAKPERALATARREGRYERGLAGAQGRQAILVARGD